MKLTCMCYIKGLEGCCKIGRLFENIDEAEETPFINAYFWIILMT
jgi:hypothetical protein